MFNIINNLFLLIACGCIAYAILQLYNYIHLLVQSYNLWLEIKRDKRDSLYQKKLKILNKKAVDYYYTMAVNEPLILANYCAKERITQLHRQGRIASLYTSLKDAV